jgi:hypothetical protein
VSDFSGIASTGTFKNEDNVNVGWYFASYNLTLILMVLWVKA